MTKGVAIKKTKALRCLALAQLIKLVRFACALWRGFMQLLNARSPMANAHRFCQVNKQSVVKLRCKPDWVCEQVLRLKAHMPHGTGAKLHKRLIAAKQASQK